NTGFDHVCNGIRQLIRSLDLIRMYLQFECFGCKSDGGDDLRVHEIAGILEDGDTPGGRNDFLDELKPLDVKLRVEKRRASHVNGGACKACDNTCGESVTARKHDDWHSCGRLFGCERSGSPIRQKNVDPEANEFGRVLGQARVVTLGPPEIDEDILAFDVTA